MAKRVETAGMMHLAPCQTKTNIKTAKITIAGVSVAMAKKIRDIRRRMTKNLANQRKTKTRKLIGERMLSYPD